MNGVRRLSTPPPTTGKKYVDPFDVMFKATEAVRTATDPAPQLATSLPGLHKSIKDSLKDLEKLTASHRHGMLRLSLPLKDSVKPRRVQIETQAEDQKQLAGVR